MVIANIFRLLKYGDSYTRNGISKFKTAGEFIKSLVNTLEINRHIYYLNIVQFVSVCILTPAKLL